MSPSDERKLSLQLLKIVKKMNQNKTFQCGLHFLFALFFYAVFTFVLKKNTLKKIAGAPDSSL